MKPTLRSVQVLILHDRQYPEGIPAWIDYDYLKSSELKWYCENAKWEQTLNEMLPAYWSHYIPNNTNHPLSAAKRAARRYRIKILTKGITSMSGLIPEGADDETMALYGIRGQNTPYTTLEKIMEQMTPELRNWVEYLSEIEKKHLRIKLREQTDEHFLVELQIKKEIEENAAYLRHKQQLGPELIKIEPISQPLLPRSIVPEEEQQANATRMQRIKEQMSPDLLEWMDNQSEETQQNLEFICAAFSEQNFIDYILLHKEVEARLKRQYPIVP